MGAGIFGNHTCRFGAALQAARPAPCVLGYGTDGGAGRLAVPGKACAVAADAALHVDTVVGVAHGAPALGDLCALRGAPLVLVARRVPVRLHRLHPRCHLGEAPWAARWRLRGGVRAGLVHPLARCFRLGERLGGRALFGGPGG